VMLGGNHDHALVSHWLDAHLMLEPPAPLGLEQSIPAEDSGPAGRVLAGLTGPATLRFSYPGIWLRDDVYGMHGHYLDLHTTVPTIERLFAGVMARVVSDIPERGARPDDYEAVLAPIYAWMFAIAQRSREGIVRQGSRSSARAWNALAGEGRHRRPVRTALLRAGFAGAVKALELAGIRPLRAELSGEALRQGYLQAMGEVTRRLDIGAAHVVFGHTHRSGPWPGDDLAEWRTADGTALVNTGSWVYQPHFLTAEPGASPYWPGSAVLVEDTGPPRLLRLLHDRGHAELAAGVRVTPPRERV